MPETTPLIKAALNLRVGAGFDVYKIYHNSIDIFTYAGYILRIDCAKAEEGLKKAPNDL